MELHLQNTYQDGHWKVSCSKANCVFDSSKSKNYIIKNNESLHRLQRHQGTALLHPAQTAEPNAYDMEARLEIGLALTNLLGLYSESGMWVLAANKVGRRLPLQVAPQSCH